jgi:hypothetical protein
MRPHYDELPSSGNTVAPNGSKWTVAWYPVGSMARTWVAPKIKQRRSKLHGWGVFALEPITKNTRIIQYEGELIDHKESFKRESRYLKKGEIWCFTLNRRWVKDGHVGGNVARFINHACKPNCYSQIMGREIWIRAGRNIEPGEELTYDYYTDGEMIIQCHCRPGCTRKL